MSYHPTHSAPVYWRELRHEAPRLNAMLNIGYAALTAVPVANAAYDLIQGTVLRWANELNIDGITSFWLAWIPLEILAVVALLLQQSMFDRWADKTDEDNRVAAAAFIRLLAVAYITTACAAITVEFGHLDTLVLVGATGFALMNNTRQFYLRVRTTLASASRTARLLF